MPIYDCVLRENFPNRAPAALQLVVRMHANHGADHVIPVTAVGAIRDHARFQLNSGAAIVPDQNVLSRVLRSHFPDAPHQVERSVSSLHS